ncbi:monoamine oxidase [Saccharopolyspora lacisalsi]|uniref:Monoamine oxidase n=1 Tax=Halosaccharopolyspora lacisalsi TaxID=1000566 RepID=A0A839E6J3_9PSEU|nr:NAD(P)/FAD-dependent oxidoreductase [Halosaccharopolyspora lacisalsi]MBA8827505.1 monoamine oxidase [Halosaccharopolyspora lacisalsi]
MGAEFFDVVVIGAGAAGLACARELLKSDLRVVVHEARDRIGGRIMTYHPRGGHLPVELGAQVVHGEHNSLWTSIGGSWTTTSFSDAAATAVVDGASRPMSALARWPNPPWSIDDRLRDVGERSLTVRRWLASLELHEREGAVAAEWLRQTWAADLAELDARGAAACRTGSRVGSGQYCLSAGYDAVIEALAEGTDVRLGTPAWEVDRSRKYATVTGPTGSVRARAVVVTAPPPVITRGTLRIDRLPVVKHAAATGLGLGDALSVVVTTSVLAPDTTVVFDADTACGFLRATAASPHVCLVCKGPSAEKLRSVATSRSGLAELLARALPWTSRADIIDVRIADWGGDPYVTGAFTFPRNGAVSDASHWAEPVADTIFFAGEATCGPAEAGSVHGAYESGRRAGRQVQEALECSAATH